MKEVIKKQRAVFKAKKYNTIRFINSLTNKKYNTFIMFPEKSGNDNE